MNLKYLILDDVRDEEACFLLTGNQLYMQGDFDIVKTYDEFVEYITTQGVPRLISFDHDLADEHYYEGSHHKFGYFNYDNVKELTGYHAAMWFVQYCIDNNIAVPVCLAHSANPYGRMKINSVFIQYNKMLKNGAI